MKKRRLWLRCSACASSAGEKSFNLGVDSGVVSCITSVPWMLNSWFISDTVGNELSGKVSYIMFGTIGCCFDGFGIRVGIGQ